MKKQPALWQNDAPAGNWPTSAAFKRSDESGRYPQVQAARRPKKLLIETPCLSTLKGLEERPRNCLRLHRLVRVARLLRPIHFCGIR